jgi:voltage-gated potassium channel
MKPERISPSTAWDAVVFAAATAVALVLPLRLALGPEKVPWFWVFDAVVSTVFIIDFIVNLRASRWSVRDEGLLWFFVDFLSAFPVHLLPWGDFMVGVRLLKMLRVGELMREWRRARLQHWNTLRLVYFAYWVGLLVQMLSIGWLILRSAGVDAPTWGGYLRALYWCIVTVTTIGYGDITPQNNVEIIYAIGVMIVGVSMYGYVIGNIATLLTNLHPARRHYLENMERLGAFMEYRGLPEKLQRRIRDYYAYVWEQRLGYDESTIVGSLPPGLHSEVSLFLKRDVIQKVPFFKGASDELIREVAIQMKPVVFTPGDFVFMAGEPGREMYFISRGQVEVISRDGSSVVAVLNEGDFFGEMALLLSRPRVATVRAVGYCDLYSLEKAAFDRILASYPKFAAHIEAMAKEREERR